MPSVAMRQSNKAQGKITMLAGKIREQKQAQSSEATSHGYLLVEPHPQRAASAHQENKSLQKQKASNQAQIVSRHYDSKGSKNDRAKCHGFSDCFSSWFLDGDTPPSVRISQQKTIADR